MCGACGSGRAAPLWEDAAGRLDAEGVRARVRAVARLTTGTGWRIRAWHGTWVGTAPSGRHQHVRTLQELFALVPATTMPVVPAGQPTGTASAPAHARWHVQAALVWVAAAHASGLQASVELPVGSGTGLVGCLTPGRPPEIRRVQEDGDVRLAAPVADRLLASLLATAG